MKTKEIQINSDFVTGYKSGDIVNVKFDDNNIPLDKFWRNRLKDSAIDNCCEIIEEKEKLKAPKIDEKVKVKTHKQERLENVNISN